MRPGGGATLSAGAARRGCACGLASHGIAHLAYGLVHALSRSVRLRFFCALCMMRPFSLMEESAFLFSDES